jgi:hypothetical protein
LSWRYLLMSARVDWTKNFTINITGIKLYPWYRLECVKLYLKQEYFEQVAEFQLTIFYCGKCLNCIKCHIMFSTKEWIETVPHTFFFSNKEPIQNVFTSQIICWLEGSETWRNWLLNLFWHFWGGISSICTCAN